jgi:hypothetical protein
MSLTPEKYRVECSCCGAVFEGDKRCDSTVHAEKCGGGYQCVLPYGHKSDHQADCRLHEDKLVMWENLTIQ